MSLDTSNEKFETEIRKHLNILETNELKRLYKLIVAESVFLDNLDCYPAYRSETSHLDFRFISKADSSKNCFAIKVCRNRLEFYFRKPAMEHFGTSTLVDTFPSLTLNQKGSINEAMLKIDNEFTLSKILSVVKKFPA